MKKKTGAAQKPAITTATTATPATAAKQTAKVATPGKKAVAPVPYTPPPPVKKTAPQPPAKTAPAAAKPAVSPTPEKKTLLPKVPVSKKLSASVTTLVAIADVGWGNRLFVRGEGAGLSWDFGIPMECRSTNEWLWRSDSPAPVLSFKFVLNDVFWEQGDNRSASRGEIYTAAPVF